MQSEELSGGQVLCEVLISTEMIKIMQWKFPQVGGGGGINPSVITAHSAIFRPGLSCPAVSNSPHQP